MLKLEIQTLYRWPDRTAFLPERTHFFLVIIITNVQKKKHKLLSSMKCHHHNHLDPDLISYSIARLNFKKLVFSNSKGTEGKTDKFISY